MIQVIPSEQRHLSDHGWLQTRLHFSFADYHDPSNVEWGPLRVFNDDTVQPGRGFDFHPHRDMEIISVVLEGAIRHRDSQGNEGVLRPGEVQVMSAGRGILHSEFNPSPDEPLRLLQIWIRPRTRGLDPRYAQRLFEREAGAWTPVVSDGSVPGTLPIDQDVTIQLAAPRLGGRLTLPDGTGRRGYLFVIAGRVELAGRTLGAGDQARLADEPAHGLTALEDADLIFLDLP